MACVSCPVFFRTGMKGRRVPAESILHPTWSAEYYPFTRIERLLQFTTKVDKQTSSLTMTHPALVNRLRSHRKRSGLTQRDLANIVGYRKEVEVSRHERQAASPPFRVALRYEAVFRVPLSDLFPTIFEQEKNQIEARLAEFAETLRQSTTRGREAARIARTLEWIWEREHEVQSSLFPSDGRT